MTTILIADDHAMFREGLKILLMGDPRFKIVGEAEDGARALAFIERERPALAILDIALPGMNGIDVVRGVESRQIATKCIMLTMHDEPEIAVSAMDAGARGYILKDHTFDDLKAAIVTVMAGRTFTSPRIESAVRDAVARRLGHDKVLTDREREVLALIAQGKANKEIAEQLAISVRTVETHRAKIMRKLDIHSHAGLIHYAMRWNFSSTP
jgi:DNA-binding NarL/FixJ family response regulator